MKNEYYENVYIKQRIEKNKSKKNSNEFADIKFKKSLGQNFLSDKNLLNKIGEYAELTKDDNVLEIGAGAGTLTKVLASRAGHVLSYEIDKNLKDKLELLTHEYKNLNFIFDDFMRAETSEIFKAQNFKVVANIPYYITTPIIFKLMQESARILTMIFMVQKEVAERFASKENCKDYGITSVVIQSVADVKLLKIVNKECFTPAPKVDSALVEIKINLNKFNIKDLDKFSKFVHNCFSMRRKTLVNNITKNYNLSKEKIINLLSLLEYNENVRPEQISVQNYVALFNLFVKNNIL